MKWLALLLLGVPLSAQSAPEIARAAGEEFGQGRLGEVRARFTPELQKELGRVHLFLMQRARFADKGRYAGVQEADCYPVDEYQGCTVSLQFGDQTDSINFVVDGDGRIAGLLDYGVVAPAYREYSWRMRWLPYGLTLVMMIFVGLVCHFRPVLPLEGDAMLARYRRWNIGLAVGFCALALGGVLGRIHMLNVAQPVAQSFGHFFALFAVTMRWTGPKILAVESPVRFAELGSSVLPRWIWPLMVLPVAILAGSAWYAASHWNAMPEPRTFKDVFGPLLLGVSALLMTYAHMLLVSFGARRSAVKEVLLKNLWPILCIQLGFVLAAGLFAVSRQTEVTLIPLAASALALIPIQRRAAQSDDWRGGYIYANPDDPAWVVRMGSGLSLNYGHRWVVVLAVAMIAQMAAVWIYVFAS
jgi:hypothetical protein